MVEFVQDFFLDSVVVYKVKYINNENICRGGGKP